MGEPTAGGADRAFPTAPRMVGAVAGGAMLALLFLVFYPLAPHVLLANGRVFSAIAVVLVTTPLVALFVTLAVAPAALQAVLSRFTRVELRDGGHVAALVVMALTLFYVVGIQTAGGVLAVEQVYGRTPEFEPPPESVPAGAPGAVNLTVNLTAAGANLTWTLPDANATGVDSYRVYRGLAAGTETFLATVENGTTYTDARISGGFAYSYVVTAVNARGEGAPSPRASVIVPVNEGVIIGGVIENMIVLILPVMFYVSFVHGVGPRQALEALGLRSDRIIRSLLIGAGVIILVMIALNLAVFLVQQVQEVSENERAQAIGLGIGIVGALAIAVGSSISEEVFFRGFLQPRIGMLSQAVVFAIAHLSYVDVLEIVVVFVLAFVFGYLYKMTRNLWAPIAGHFVFNLINLLAIVCTNDPTSCGLPP